MSDSWDSYWYDEDKCPQDILDFLSQLEDAKEIDIYVNSGGGSVHAGLAIYNQLKRYSGIKRAYIDGIGASISSVIPFACNEVYIYNTSQIMVHKPWTAGMGNADDFRKLADTLDSCQTAIVNAYMDNVQEGVTREQVEELVNNETYLTGKEIQDIFRVTIIEEEGQSPFNAKDFEAFNSNHDKPNNEAIERLKVELELLTL